MVDDAKARSERINNEMLDSFDEELELEIDDDRLARLLDEASEHPDPECSIGVSTSRSCSGCKASW